MADQNFQDKTEQATPKRLDEARTRGEIPRSRELNMAAVLLMGALTLYANGAQLMTDIREVMTRSLQFDRAALEDPGMMLEALRDAGLAALSAMTPLFVALAAAAVLGALIIGGWIFTPAPLAFKLERLDPVAGLGRMFSLNSLVEVAKSLTKAAVIIGFAVALLWSSTDELLALSAQPLEQAMASSMSLTLVTLALCSAAVLLIAAIDAPYQLWAHARKLRMSRKEIEDELKEAEGRPEVRSRLRALQQETARQRMLQDVPTADVVVTNPTHFAVALRYDDGRMRAPVVVAKGADHVAARIRAVADEHRVTRFESPLLARALYWTTDIGAEIPSSLYLAVAQVLTYVHRLRVVREDGGAMPEKPTVDVDASLAQPQRRRRRR